MGWLKGSVQEKPDYYMENTLIPEMEKQLNKQLKEEVKIDVKKD